MSWIWKAIILYFASILLLRMSGRKSLSQMTIGTTVVMISIGAVIVNPLVDKGVGKTVLVIALFVVVLMVMEYLELKLPWVQSLMVGKPIVVVQDGVVNQKVLRKLRMTEEKLNMRLRKHGIARVADVQVATIEANGEIGYHLVPEAEPLTVRDFKRLMGMADASQGASQPPPELFRIEGEDSTRARG